MPYILDTATTEAGASLTDLLNELYARGYDHLSQDAAGQARATRWINQAYAKLTLEELWPFRLTTTTGLAPLTINDVDRVLTVVNSDDANRELDEATERELTTFDLSLTGTPLFYFRDSLIVRVWPVATASIAVRYYRLPSELASGTDTTLVPKRYMDVLIDDAVRRAAKDRDNAEAVGLAGQEYESGLALMRRQLLIAPTHVQRIPWTHGDE